MLSDKDVVFVRQHGESATFYMTQKGEDYAPLIGIYEDLIDQLSVDYKRKQLITYFNSNVCPQYFRTAIKYALAGRFTFMNTVLKAKSSILWNVWAQLLYCTPLALSVNLREYLCIKRAQKFMRQNNMK